MNDESLIESLLPAVEQQLESTQTPYVKETFVRLVEKEKLTPDEAKGMIAAFAEAAEKGEHVAVLDGRMVEALHVAEARRMVEFADAIAALEGDQSA